MIRLLVTFNKILKGYAMEALIDLKEPTNADLESLRTEFVGKIKSSEVKEFKSVRHGNDHRIESEHLAASSLIVEVELVHFSAISVMNKTNSYRTRDFLRRRL